MRNSLTALALLWAAAPAIAAPVVVGFEGINASYPSATSAQILGFYDGGTSSDGTSGATLGMTFSANAVAVCLNSLSITCSNASTGGATPTSATGALGLAADGSAVLDFASAYTGAIGFRYAVRYPGGVYLDAPAASIAAYDGAGGTGTLLISLDMTGSAIGCPAYAAQLCPFTPGGLGMLTNVQSLVFTGTAGRVVWDDLTFGAGNDPLAPPASAPEPAGWALMLAGVRLVGGALRRQGLVRA